MSGLRATQASLALVSSNVANAETPGYVRKTVNQITGVTGDFGSSVRINGVNRELDAYLQTQIRTEMSGAAYADVRSTFLANLQTVYGNPDSTGTIEDAFNALTTAVQGCRPARTLNRRESASSMRAIDGGATQCHDAGNPEPACQRRDRHQRFHQYGEQCAEADRFHHTSCRATDRPIHRRRRCLTSATSTSTSVTACGYQVVTNSQNQATVFTNSGVQLVGTEAAQLTFNPQGTVTPNTLYNADPTKSNLGTITIDFPHGGSYDMVSTNAIRSGKIAAYLELRDNTL